MRLFSLYRGHWEKLINHDFNKLKILKIAQKCYFSEYVKESDDVSVSFSHNSDSLDSNMNNSELRISQFGPFHLQMVYICYIAAWAVWEQLVAQYQWAAVPGLGFDSQCYCLLGLSWNPAGRLFTNGGFKWECFLGTMTVKHMNLSSGKLFNQSLWSFVSVHFHTLVAKFLSLFVWGHCEEWPLFIPAIETSVSDYICQHQCFLLFWFYYSLNIKMGGGGLRNWCKQWCKCTIFVLHGRLFHLDTKYLVTKL